MQPEMTVTPVHPATIADQPMPVVWSDRLRGSGETALDSETAITLACHLSQVFSAARDWYALACGLAERGFCLRFEGARLVLVSDFTGQSLCTCGSLGHSFASLLARLGKPAVLAETGRVIPRPAR